MTSPRVASLHHRCQPKLVQEEIMRNMQDYEAGSKDEAANVALQHKGISPVAPASGTNASTATAFHSPSSSETSSLFSTVDCSSFSSRSDASSFAKEEVSLIIPSMSVSVSSSIEFTPSGVDVGVDSGSKHGETNARETGYFEFSFLEGKLIENDNKDGSRGGSEADRKLSSIKSDCLISREVPEAAPITSQLKENSVQDDGYETFPVWTDRTRYCSKNIHSCINPCFDKAGEAAEPRTSRRSKLARSLGSVISKHLALSPGPTFRKSSYERFSSRLALDHPSPLSEKCFPATPSRTFEKANSNKSTGTENRLSSAAVSRADVQKPKAKCDVESPADIKTSLYGTSPRRNLDPRKSLGCLGISNGASKSPAEETSTEVYKGPLYFASEDSVHGGKNRCLPSPRLSFGSGKTPVTLKQDRGQLTNATMSMLTPSSTAHGHLHCIVRGELPSFTFLVDGLEEVLVAKAIKPSSPDSLETGELVYSFYSWKPKGRARGNWKNWVKKGKTIPDFVGKMTLTSKVVPANTKDGDDMMELEFVLLDDTGACSPRLSFSTWETGSSPHVNCRSPSPGIYSLPSPFSVITPSPGRLPSSRYVSLSMVPTNLTSPRVEKPDRQLRRSKRSQNCSPLRAKSDDERSSFQDAWSDTEVTEFPESAEPREHSELAAIVIKIPSCGSKSFETLSQKWGWSKKLNKASVSSRKSSSSYYRRLSLPGRFQTTETKENVLEDKKCNRKEIAGARSKTTQSFKLRELMGVKDEFGSQEHEHSTIAVVLPVGSHGLPLYGTGGPQPLLDRWRSGGRCDCGSWDLGCGLNILEGGHEHHPQKSHREDGTIKIFSQGKIQNHVAMSLGALDDGLFSFSFQAPMSYLQAFASAVAILYSRGPAAVDSETFSKPPRIPLRPLSHQRPEVLAGYCSPPPSCLLDRL